MKKILFTLLVVAGFAISATAGDLVMAPGGGGIEGCYVAVVRNDAVVQPGAKVVGFTMAQRAVDLSTRYRGRLTHTYTRALNGFAACGMTREDAEALASDENVLHVEQDQRVFATVTQSPATWGIDRIDQRNLPLSNSYTYNFNGAGVHAYIIDTGIRATHTNFGGRVSSQGFTAINDGQGTNDCNGHGTHVSGTVGSATYGVAKGVTLHAVRVLDCGGSGTNAGVIAGVDWVTQNRILPAVANMSLGGGVSTALDTAVNNSINAGVTYGVAAGNDNGANACNGSPARVPAAITVGSTTTTDARSSFSNIGTCVDIFAPGSGITSTWNTSNTATNTISGTSMATPHVVGVAALYLHQFGNQSAATVRNAIVNNATTGVVGNAGAGSPNRLLHSLFGGTGGTTVFSDDFETNKGWTRNPNGTDNATTGLWERGDPEQTASGTSVMQLGTTPSGVNALVTARLAGASVGANDVDGGTTSIQSPAITLPSTGTLTLSFSFYFAHLNNSSSADFFRVSIVGSSGTSQVFQELGAATTDVASYTTQSVSLNSFAGQTIRILIQTADASTGSLVEAAVDNVTITQQ